MLRSSSSFRFSHRLGVNRGLLSPLLGAKAPCTRLFSTAPKTVHVHEVSPRDGIQNEKQVLSIDEKIELIRLLAKGNPDSIEVASFVRPDLVPAMATSFEVSKMLRDLEWVQNLHTSGMGFAGLVPNSKGLETFLKARGDSNGAVLDTVVCMVSATESHSKANVRRSVAEALLEIQDVIAGAKSNNLTVNAYVSLAFGCPFEGNVEPEKVAEIAHSFQQYGADVVILADTLGHASPEQVTKVIDTICDPKSTTLSTANLGLHMHNASGRAVECIAAGIQAGVGRFDAANGGCGGCNFIPNAKGNVSTQALLRELKKQGIVHQMQLEENQLASENARLYLETVIGRELEQ